MELAGGLVLLLPNAAYDLWKRKISLIWTGICGGAGMLWQIYMQTSVWALVGALIPCAVLLVAGFLRPGSVGMGDVLIIGALGMWCGLEGVLWVLGIGCMLLSLICIPLMIFGKVRRDTTVPLVPSLLAGLLVYWCLSIVG